MRYFLPIELHRDNVYSMDSFTSGKLRSGYIDEHILTQVDKMHAIARGNGVSVGVVDTGISQHFDLESNRVFAVSGVGYGGSDRHGHGTHCAGIAGSSGQSGRTKGTAPESKVYCAKGLTDDGWGDDKVIAECIDALSDMHIDVISLSIGGDGRSDLIAQSVKRAQDNGAIVVAASGNGGNSYPRDSYPGGLPDVFTVGACDNAGRIASFSQPSNDMDMVAPGVNYLSTYPDNRFARLSGTSMATPHVAGAIVSLISHAKSLGMKTGTRDMHDLIFDAINETAKDVSAPGRDKLTGYGIPMFAKAIEYIQNELIGKTPPPADPKDPAEEIIIEIDKAKHKNIRNINIKFT